MTSRRWLLLISTLVSLVPSIATQANPKEDDAGNNTSSCLQPALSRLIRHKIAPGETLESIAQQYNLIPATLMGMNSGLRAGKVAIGSEIVIPPYNGIRVEIPAGQTWQQVAATYRVRADVLFEINGCQRAPRVVFVPGVNWSPERPTVPVASELAGYPLPSIATVALNYGWQIHPYTGKVFFNSGLDLLAAAGTPVLAVGVGTVAFAGEQGSYGNLVVVNHQRGRQSRYAHLQSVAVRTGQTVKQGNLLGKVGSTGNPTGSEPHLHFEVRYSSSLGWVAEDPSRYLQQRKAGSR
jgi:murein DD-endopeptidase MepM/ murein hydrolase activator NlpD